MPSVPNIPSIRTALTPIPVPESPDAMADNDQIPTFPCSYDLSKNQTRSLAYSCREPLRPKNRVLERRSSSLGNQRVATSGDDLIKNPVAGLHTIIALCVQRVAAGDRKTGGCAAAVQIGRAHV